MPAASAPQRHNSLRHPSSSDLRGLAGAFGRAWRDQTPPRALRGLRALPIDSARGAPHMRERPIRFRVASSVMTLIRRGSHKRLGRNSLYRRFAATRFPSSECGTPRRYGLRNQQRYQEICGKLFPQVDNERAYDREP